MKKVVALAVALSLVVAPTLVGASFQYDDGVLIAKKGGNGNGNSGNNSNNSGKGNRNGNGNNTIESASQDTTESTPAVKPEQKTKKQDKTIQDKDRKKVEKAASKLDKAAIKEERKRILEEFKNDKAELKARAKEMRQQAKNADNYKEEKAEILEAAAALLEAAEELDEAIEALEEAVKSDLKNIDRYKRLAKLMEKKGNKNIKAFINGKHAKFDVPPVIKSGRTLVPIRAISESLGAKVTWNESEKTVLIEKDGIEIKLILDDVKAYIDGKEIKLDVPSSSINSRIVVPLRFISEAFDAAVEWDKETESVIIVDEDESKDDAPVEDNPSKDDKDKLTDDGSIDETNTEDTPLVTEE